MRGNLPKSMVRGVPAMAILAVAGPNVPRAAAESLALPPVEPGLPRPAPRAGPGDPADETRGPAEYTRIHVEGRCGRTFPPCACGLIEGRDKRLRVPPGDSGAEGP